MDLWNIGFGLLITGIAIPGICALYKFVLTPVDWYWRISLIFVMAGILVLLASAIKEKVQATPPEREV